MNIKAKLLWLAIAAAVSSTTNAEVITPRCITTFRDLCGTASASREACFECARNNTLELEDVECQPFIIERVCKAVAAGGLDQPQCRGVMERACPKADYPVTRDCATCAKSKIDTILESGCDFQAVTDICKSRTSTDIPGSQCRGVMERACPKADYPVTRDCASCAKSKIDTILESGCDFQTAAEICKSRTSTDIPVVVPETVLPVGATDEHPLRVFIQAGQSGCSGAASVTMMNDDPEYEELQGVQEGVWFAGIKRGFSRSGTLPEHFFMGPMLAGEASKTNNTMGPEVAIGRRLYDADQNKAPVLMIKYCWGGSNLEMEWNPATPFNSWDKDQDDGTAEWLWNEPTEGGADLGDKKHLYANLIYTVRRSLELLDDADIPYKLSGMFWLQGAADKDRTWKEYGADTVRFFEAVRTELDTPNLPIVDEGSIHNNVNTGKDYAASVIHGCNMIVPKMAMAAPDPDVTDCIPGPSNACTDTTFINWEFFDYYGYDPKFLTPEFDIRPPGSSDEIFYWFKNFPNDQHMEYEGKILQGRMMANAYILSFTDDVLELDWFANDSGFQFPFLPCDPTVNNGKPGPDLICYMDQRSADDLAESTCSASLIDFDLSATATLATGISSDSTVETSSSLARIVLSAVSAFFWFYTMA